MPSSREEARPTTAPDCPRRPAWQMRTHRRSPGRSGGAAGIGSVRMDIIAPAGKLGVMLDPPPGGRAPRVKGVGDAGQLLGKIRVGDRVIALDGEDVLRMKAVDVSSECRRVSLTSTLVLGRTTNSFVFHALRPLASLSDDRKEEQASGEEDHGFERRRRWRGRQRRTLTASVGLSDKCQRCIAGFHASVQRQRQL